MNKVLYDSLDDELEFQDPGQRRERLLDARRAHPPKKTRREVRASVEQRAPDQVAGGLKLSAGLDATNEERAYLVEQLAPFFHAKHITAVLRRVKGGKEANVYCCAAHPDTGLELLAAKVYRPRKFRNLKNDNLYREGRAVLNSRGEALDLRHDWRTAKAIAGKSRHGLRVQQVSWTAYEFYTLQQLYQAGADVPRPVHNSEHTLLMEYFGDEVQAAPTLHLVALEPEEARPMFERLMRNVELMLSQHYVHGDLSAYNVLYWEGDLRLIDFPQVVDVRGNSQARAIFERDVTRLCQYFARYGVQSQPLRLAREMWERYPQPEPDRD